jgi:hypothetical protein
LPDAWQVPRKRWLITGGADRRKLAVEAGEGLWRDGAVDWAMLQPDGTIGKGTLVFLRAPALLVQETPHENSKEVLLLLLA